MRDGARTGRRPIWNERSAIRADLLLERTAEKVAAARTSVPPAVANDAMVAQSVLASAYAVGSPRTGSVPSIHGRGPWP